MGFLDCPETELTIEEERKGAEIVIVGLVGFSRALGSNLAQNDSQ